MSRSKRAPCPNCCPAPGRAYFTEDYCELPDGSYGWAWRCSNCWLVIPKRTRKVRADRESPSQTATADRLIHEAETKLPNLRGEAQELTRELTEHGLLHVSFWIGYPDLPDNAFGNVYRDFYSFHVGRNGGAFTYGKRSDQSRKVRRIRVRRVYQARVN